MTSVETSTDLPTEHTVTQSIRYFPVSYVKSNETQVCASTLSSSPASTESVWRQLKTLERFISKIQTSCGFGCFNEAVAELMQKNTRSGLLEAEQSLKQFMYRYFTELNCAEHGTRSMSAWKQICVGFFASYAQSSARMFGHQSNFDHYLRGLHKMSCDTSQRA